MNNSTDLRGIALITRCTWLASKIGFIALASVSLLVLVLLIGIIMYKSFELGVRPLEIIHEMEGETATPSTSLLFSSTLSEMYFHMGSAVFAGTIFCAFIGACIGLLAAMAKSFRAES